MAILKRHHGDDDPQPQQEEQKLEQDDTHLSFGAVFKKLGKDNIGVLGSIVAWNVLTAIVPIVVGLIAISGFFLQGNAGAQASVVSHLSQALQNVLSPAEIQRLVSASTKHAGLLGIIGFLGLLWGGSGIGGAISTVFQAIFEVKGRSFLKEKLIDIGMIFVFTVLMILIILGTTAGALVKQMFSGFALSGPATFVIGTAISIVAAFLLFASIYTVFPNVETRFKLGNVWKGAVVAAVLFEILTYIFPIYTRFAHFQSHGALLGAIALLMAWIYFFSMTMILGAEVVAIEALQQANKDSAEVGPEPEDSVPQHSVLRGK